MKIVLNPAYKTLNSFVNQIHDTFDKNGEIIYDGRNQLRVYQVQNFQVVVKRFKVPHLINRIAYSFFRPSKAMRSYKYALKLLELGISTPSPIAYIEQKKAGIIAYSYYICIYEHDACHIRQQMLDQNSSPEFLRELAAFIASMHQKGVLHQDLSPGNILYKLQDGVGHFSVIDINRMKFLNFIEKKIRFYSFRRLSENNRVISELATYYADYSGFDRQTTILAITKACRDFIKTDLY